MACLEVFRGKIGAKVIRDKVRIVMPQTLSAFTANGRFWRGNLHTHSTRSDGVLAPAEVCRRYRAEGV